MAQGALAAVKQEDEEEEVQETQRASAAATRTRQHNRSAQRRYREKQKVRDTSGSRVQCSAAFGGRRQAMSPEALSAETMSTERYRLESGECSIYGWLHAAKPLSTLPQAKLADSDQRVAELTEQIRTLHMQKVGSQRKASRMALNGQRLLMLCMSVAVIGGSLGGGLLSAQPASAVYV